MKCNPVRSFAAIIRGEILSTLGETTLKPRRFSNRNDFRWLSLILAVQFLTGLAAIVVLPLWQEHEPDYYTVVRFLTENGRLPTEADYPPGEADVRQATQPPLFFLAAAPAVALLDDAQPVPPGSQPGLICIGGETANPVRIAYPLTPDYLFPTRGAVLAGYALRLLNLVFGLIAVAFTWLAGRILFPQRPSAALVGAALLALEPNVLSMVTTISNDALLLAIAAINLYCAARMLAGGLVRWRWILLLMLTAVLAILTRLSGWAVFGFSVLVVLYAIGHTFWQARKHARTSQVRLAVGGLLLLIVAGIGLAAFNYSQYGSIFGRYRWLDELVLRTVQDFNLPLATITGVFSQTHNSFLTPFSAFTTRPTFQTLYTLPVLVALLGALIGFVVAVLRRLRSQPAPMPGSFLLLIASVAVAVALVLFRNSINVSAGGGVTLYNTATIFAPLRYYNTGLPSLALLLSAGLMVLVEPVRAWADERHNPLLRRLIDANVLGISLTGLWLVVGLLGILLIARDRSAAQVIDLQTYQSSLRQPAEANAVQNGDYPVLYSHVASPRPENGFIDLTLHAGISSPTALNYAAEVEMTSGGQVINRCQFLPAGGYYPTTLWQPETVLTFTAALPNCAGTLDSPVNLSLRWLGANANGEIQEASPPISLGTIDASLAQAMTCPQTLAIIAGGYRLTQFNSPPSVRIGETYLPSVNWIVTQPSPDAVGRTFIFTHEETDEQYTCAGFDLPVQSWELGEYVYFERCSMTFPPEATPGTYAVSVVLYDAAGAWLPATDAAGNPLPNNAAQVGTIQLEQ